MIQPTRLIQPTADVSKRLLHRLQVDLYVMWPVGIGWDCRAVGKETLL
jgi:hypothetical protein